MLAPDQILNKGRYQIINPVCQNETGGAYIAFDTVSQVKVTLLETVGKFGKVATSSQIAAFNQTFAAGAEVLTAIDHEYLVPVRSYFSEIDRQYLVLGADDSSDLTQFLNGNESPPELQLVMTWAEQLLNALSYLHKLSPPIYHRDIHPENIKLSKDNRVKLFMTGVGTTHTYDLNKSASNRTVSNTAFHYRPLEQLWPGLDFTSQRVILNDYDDRSEAVLLKPFDARSDLYSFAASIYHVLTGTLPFDALDRSIAVHEGKPDPLLSPTEIDDKISSEISKIILTAMAIRRENRFDSAGIMLQVLRSAAARTFEQLPESAKGIAAPAPAAIPAILAPQPAAVAHSRGVNENQDNTLPAMSEAVALQVDEENLLDFESGAIADESFESEAVLELEPELNSNEPDLLWPDSLSAEPESPGPFEITREEEEVWHELLTEETPNSAARWKMPAMAAAAVLVIACSAGVWKVMSVAEPKPSQIEQHISAPVNVVTDIATAPVQNTTNVQDDNTDAETGLASTATTPELVPGDGPDKRNPQIAKQEKVKKSAVLTEKTPAPKKKLTVDDLIKDN